MSSDLQNAYQVSCQTYEYARVQVPVGMFAVVFETLAYCPITDATLPSTNHHLIRLCGSRRIADYYAKVEARKAFGDEGCFDDARVVVLPRAFDETPYRPAVGDDDIPF